MLKRSLVCLSLMLLLVTAASAQRATVTMILDDAFFDALLQGVFRNDATLDFPLGDDNSPQTKGAATGMGSSCEEMVSIRREGNGRKTAARLADGKILAPLVFSGKYNPPLLPCFGYSGFAETEIVLDFDSRNQTLVGRVVVNKVSLSGTGGIGGGLVARMVQSSIDKKVNPIKIVGLDNVSVTIPVQESANVAMKAVDVKHRITKGILTLTITYEFSRL